MLSVKTHIKHKAVRLIFIDHVNISIHNSIYVVILNMYEPSNRATMYVKQKLIEHEEEIDKYIMIVGDFSTLILISSNVHN